MSYAKHQSFYLKSNWINKGIKAIIADPLIFTNKDNFLKIGIGKNMFFSLKYWLEALNIVKFNNGVGELTDFGHYINRCDLSCNEAKTLLLMHYFLTLNKPYNDIESSTGFFWFFNINNNSNTRKVDFVNDLVKWDTSTFHRSTSEKTIEKDLDCLLLTYTKSEKAHPEDKNTSVLSKLKLIEKENDLIVRLPLSRTLLDKDVLFFLILRQSEFLQENDITFLSIYDLLEGEMSPGKLLHLSRIDLIEILEEMINDGYPFQIVRTNNLDTIAVSSSDNSNLLLQDMLEKCGAK